MRSLDDVPLTDAELARIDAYWRAANCLTVGQIYLLENALLGRPLVPADVKPRLLGHWGTSPGLNMIYAGTVALSRRDTCRFAPNATVPLGVRTAFSRSR